MNRRSWYSLSLAALIVLVALALVGCGDSGNLPSAGSDQTGTTTAAGGQTGTTTGGSGNLTASLNGAGATFPGPLYLEWIGEFQQTQPGVKINYQAIGSGGGIQQFTQGTVDFGASDAPMKDEEIATAEQQAGAKVLHIPTVFGAVTLAYNLKDVTELKLDADTLAAIFLGAISKWNDTKLAALNQGVKLPDEAIQIVHRSDSSGTTSIFTTYLSAVSPEWKAKVGPGKDVKWPVGVGGQGNKGVAAVVQQQPGSIGYVELSYAAESKLPVAQLKNKSGKMITPSLASTSAAAEGVTFPADLRFDLVNSAEADAYPIVGATWILAWDTMKDPAKAAALKAWLEWDLNDGAQIAKELNYAPLPDSLKQLALEKVNAIH